MWLRVYTKGTCVCVCVCRLTEQRPPPDSPGPRAAAAAGGTGSARPNSSSVNRERSSSSTSPLPSPAVAAAVAASVFPSRTASADEASSPALSRSPGSALPHQRFSALSADTSPQRTGSYHGDFHRRNRFAESSLRAVSVDAAARVRHAPAVCTLLPPSCRQTLLGVSSIMLWISVQHTVQQVVQQIRNKSKQVEFAPYPASLKASLMPVSNYRIVLLKVSTGDYLPVKIRPRPYSSCDVLYRIVVCHSRALRYSHWTGRDVFDRNTHVHATNNTIWPGPRSLWEGVTWSRRGATVAMVIPLCKTYRRFMLAL